MKLFHFALAFMLLLTACSKDDEKAQESSTYAEEMWTTDQAPLGIVITSNDAYYVTRILLPHSGYYWLDYGEIGSLQDIDIYNVVTDFGNNDSTIPIQENHGYIMKSTGYNSSGTKSIDYTAYYITEIHRDQNGNILYIKVQGRGFVPYQHWL